jgi:hypothetical protein
MRNEVGFAERQSASAKAKRALLERARVMAPSNDPAFAERQAQRRAVVIARKARIAERRAAKAAEAAARAAAEAEALRVAEVERAAAEAAAAELAAKQKAVRDAKYAARKMRGG